MLPWFPPLRVGRPTPLPQFRPGAAGDSGIDCKGDEGLLGIALLAALVTSTALAEDGRLYLEPAHRRVFFNGETDNTVDGPATLPEAKQSVMVLRACHDLPASFMVEAMLGLGNSDAIVGTSPGPTGFETTIEHRVRFFGKLRIGQYRGVGVHSRIGVASVTSGGSHRNLAGSDTSDGMDCAVGGEFVRSHVPSLRLDATQYPGNGASARAGDGVGAALVA